MDKSFIFGVGLTVAFSLLYYLVKAMPRVVSLGGIFFGIGLMVWAALTSHYWARFAETHPTASTFTMMALVMAVTLAVGTLIVLTNPNIKPDELETLPKPLAYYFENDFENTMRGANKRTVKSQDGEEYALDVKVFMDFYSNAWFGGFFLPRSHHSYPAAVCLAREYNKLFEPLMTGLYVQSKHPGEPVPTDNKQMSFTGRVYLYHEDDFSLRDRADLLELFKLNGASLQFRGSEYAINRWTTERMEAK